MGGLLAIARRAELARDWVGAREIGRRVGTNVVGISDDVDGAMPTPMEKLANLRTGKAGDVSYGLHVVEAKGHIGRVQVRSGLGENTLIVKPRGAREFDIVTADDLVVGQDMTTTALWER